MIEIGYDKESKFSISNIGKIFRTLTKNLYPNPLESSLIETVSNARDSMIAAGKSVDPIFLTVTDDREVIIEDTGTGMSKDFMLNKYTDIGYSNKENDSESIGKYGLGRLAILSYCESYKVRSICDGIEIHYIISSNEFDTPDIDIVLEKPSKGINGVKVTFSLKENSRDYFNPTEEGKTTNIITNKLMFFENLIIEGLSFDNEHKVYEFNNFKFSSNNNTCNILHGECVYPIKWELLPKVTELYVPLALSFDLSVNLEPTPDRTSIKWTSEAIELISKKVEDTLKELENLYVSQIGTFENIFDLKNIEFNHVKLGESSFSVPHSIRLNTSPENFYIGKKIKNFKLLYNYSSLDQIASIKRFGRQTRLITKKENLEDSYLVEESKLNKYKKQHQNTYFLLLNKNFKEEFSKNIISEGTSDYYLYVKDVLEDESKLKKDIKEVNKQFLDYINSKVKDISTLTIKDKIATVRTSRKEQVYGVFKKYTILSWKDCSALKGKFYTTNKETYHSYENLFPYNNSFYIKENQVKKLIGFTSLEDHLKSNHFTNYFNRASFKKMMCSFAQENRVKFRYKTLIIGFKEDFIYYDWTEDSRVKFLEKYQTFNWQKMYDNTIKYINFEKRDYDSAYEYLYFKTKQKYKKLKEEKKLCLN